MRKILPENLWELAKICEDPLYLVGGSVRDFLLGDEVLSPDWDLASPMSEEEFVSCATKKGFTVKAVYGRTGTVKLEDKAGVGYEFTRFRSDRYAGGSHVPAQVAFTRDIEKDAVRRDFRVNAIYYDIKGDRFCDPLGGREDLKRKVLRTVAPAEKVFGEDGLRLLRLGRFVSQLGFSPDGECLRGAALHSALIEDIVPERVFREMELLLNGDLKRGFGDGPYEGLKLLKEIGVFKRILPELALGENMSQRADFHDHDVLEHSLRCVRYSHPSVRFAALLHDVGKPLCKLRDGDFHNHPEEGERLTREILGRWKAPKKLIEETAALVRLHMRDYNLEMKESKLRTELVKDYPLLNKLLLVKQADYSACKDDLNPAPCVVKWKNLYSRMREEGVPFTLKELKLNGDDLKKAGVPGEKVGETLRELQMFCAEDGSRNHRERLLKHLGKTYE